MAGWGYCCRPIQVPLDLPLSDWESGNCSWDSLLIPHFNCAKDSKSPAPVLTLFEEKQTKQKRLADEAAASMFAFLSGEMEVEAESNATDSKEPQKRRVSQTDEI